MSTPLYTLVAPGQQDWRESNAMRIPNTSLGVELGATQLGLRLWRLPPMSANTWHRHAIQEEIFYVLKGTGRIRIGDESVTVPEGGAVRVEPTALRQVFNDTNEDTLWLIVGAPWNELEALPQDVPPGEYIYPEGQMKLPPELEGSGWPPTASPD